MNTLKDQLAKEMQQKQSFISRSAQKSDEIKDIRGKLTESLNNVSRRTFEEPAVLEREAQKLDDTVDHHSTFEVTPSYSLPGSSPYSGSMRRTKSSSPTPRISPEKLHFSSVSMTPTTDPGISPPKRSTPISTGVRRSFVGAKTPISNSLSKTRKHTS